MQIAADGGVAVRMRYIGTGTVTSVTVITGTSITMITSDGGTDVYAFGTYTTVGRLVDAINADGIFEAKVLDTLRSYATATQFVNGAIASSTYNGTTVWDLKVDSSAAKYLALRLTYDRGFDKRNSSVHRVHLQEYVYFATLGSAAADMALVYEVTPGGLETKKIGDLSVSATATTLNFASGRGKLTADEGNDLVVVIKDAASLSDTGAYLRVTGILE